MVVYIWLISWGWFTCWVAYGCSTQLGVGCEGVSIYWAGGVTKNLSMLKNHWWEKIIKQTKHGFWTGIQSRLESYLLHIYRVAMEASLLLQGSLSSRTQIQVLVSMWSEYQVPISFQFLQKLFLPPPDNKPTLYSLPSILVFPLNCQGESLQGPVVHLQLL